MNENVKLYNGDCLDVMDNLIEQGIKVDAIITDPPYGTTACKWDSVIPFEAMWERLNNISNKNTPIILFGSEPFTSCLIHSNIGKFKERVDWLKNKSGNGFRADQKHIDVIEDIIVFGNSVNYTFNPQKWLVSDKEFLTQRKTFNEVEVGNNIYAPMKRVRKADTGERNPINIVSCRVPFTPAKSKSYSEEVDIRFHPTQKPIDLMEYLIKTYTNEGGIVLDFTMGSGTTGVAALNLNRKFIGIELDEGYFNIAGERIYTSIQESNFLIIKN